MLKIFSKYMVYEDINWQNVIAVKPISIKTQGTEILTIMVRCLLYTGPNTKETAQTGLHRPVCLYIGGL